jgi:hypothetical protein
MLIVVTQSVTMTIFVILNVAKQSVYAECHCVEWSVAMSTDIVLNLIKQNVILLSYIMLSVMNGIIMLCLIVLNDFMPRCHYAKRHYAERRFA